MNSEGLKERLAALRERRARIDAEIEQLEAQLDAQERAGRKGAEVLEVEPARGGGSYVLQKVRCGKPTCRCARAGREVSADGLMLPGFMDISQMEPIRRMASLGKLANIRPGCEQMDQIWWNN